MGLIFYSHRNLMRLVCKSISFIFEGDMEAAGQCVKRKMLWIFRRLNIRKALRTITQCFFILFLFPPQNTSNAILIPSLKAQANNARSAMSSSSVWQLFSLSRTSRCSSVSDARRLSWWSAIYPESALTSSVQLQLSSVPHMLP